ncbi:hypothetical protein GALL_513010 [mine drainage metagenome]|uniref:Uncharacterized protein n=1 Tax=mine drainage metagenome TaxID=410659 RepID=A0A1J5PHW2_9ZZZZ
MRVAVDAVGCGLFDRLVQAGQIALPARLHERELDDVLPGSSESCVLLLRQVAQQDQHRRRLLLPENDVLVQDERQLHAPVALRRRRRVVLRLDQHCGEFILGHARDHLGLVGRVASTAPPVADDGSVVAGSASCLALVQQDELHLLVEVVVIDASGQVVWMRRVAPDLAGIDDHRAVGRVRQHQVRRLADGIENRLPHRIEPAVQVQPEGLDLHFPGGLDRGTRSNHRVDEDLRRQPLEQFLVHVTRAVAAPVAAAPFAAVGVAEDAHAASVATSETSVMSAKIDCRVTRTEASPFFFSGAKRMTTSRSGSAANPRTRNFRAFEPSDRS